MLSVDYIHQLPLDLRILIANMDMKVYMRMYIYDGEFRSYATKDAANFIERFVIMREYFCSIYKINNITYYKYDNGREEWYRNGVLHRLDGPAIISYEYTAYYNDGKRHRLNGPAIMMQNPNQVEYFINGERHRLDGAAIICTNGYQSYFINGHCHRLNGPAVIHPDGSEEYYIDGKEVNAEEWLKNKYII